MSTLVEVAVRSLQGSEALGRREERVAAAGRPVQAEEETVPDLV